MKKVFCCLLLIAFFVKPVFGFQNSPDGFRGLKWGDSPSAMGNYNLETKDDDYLKIYSRPDDKMSLGVVPLDMLKYVFCVDRLMGISIRINSKHFVDMKQILITQYGEPFQKNKYIEKYYWLDNNAFIEFENFRAREYCELRISSLAEVKLMDKVQKERAQMAADDF